MRGRTFPESRAEVIARALARTHGNQALAQAHHRRDRAKAEGNHRRLDFYIAVCTIIADRDRTFSRSRAIG